MPTALKLAIRGPAERRFWIRVSTDAPPPEHRPELGPCWLWVGLTVEGYGRFWIGPRPGMATRFTPAHRWSYERYVGLIPEGLHIDHLCRVRNCVRPTHLEPVTNRENLLRGETVTAKHAAKTHCPEGHPYAGDNLIVDGGSRRCRTCRLAGRRRRYHERKQVTA